MVVQTRPVSLAFMLFPSGPIMQQYTWCTVVQRLVCIDRQSVSRFAPVSLDVFDQTRFGQPMLQDGIRGSRCRRLQLGQGLWQEGRSNTGCY